MSKSVIGLTGPAAAGKSTVAQILAGLGAQVIDVDKRGHETLLDPAVIERIRERFGNTVLDDAGQINRHALGKRVFSDDRELAALEEIVHPAMCQAVREQSAALRATGQPCVIDAALLHALKLDEICDHALIVVAPFYERLDRARSRNWSEGELRLRDEALSRSLPPEAFNGQPPAAGTNENETYIVNTGALPELEHTIHTLWKELGNV